jgi:hypothetical protein
VAVFDQTDACGAGVEVQIITFTSNSAGVANWNQKVSLSLSTIDSIGIREEPANTLVACADVVQ